MKHPLLRVVLFYAAGILTASYFPFPLLGLLALAIVLVLVAALTNRLRALLLGPVLFLAGASNFTYHTANLSPIDLRSLLSPEGQLVTVRGRLLETPTLRFYEQGEKAEWRTLARVAVSGLCFQDKSWQPAHGHLAVTTRTALTNFFAGQAIEVTGVAAPPRSAFAVATFDYAAYLRQQDIYYLLQAESDQDWRQLGPRVRPPLADRFRAWARHALQLGLPSEDESLRLEWALTLGWKPALTEEDFEPFVRAATYHIFAVDGLRMAIIFGIFFGLFRAIGIPRSITGLALLPLIWFYVGLTGWPASAIRAAVMLTVVVLSWPLKRPLSILNSLFCAAFLILLWEPQQLFQAGFQLSFLVVLCLILILPPCLNLVRTWAEGDPLRPARFRRRWPNFVRTPARHLTDTLLTSFAAWIGSIPLVAYYFHIVTPVSTPANVVAVPLCGLVLVSNLSSLLFAAWLPSVSEVFNHAGWFLMECIRLSSQWFAAWPKAYFYVPQPGLLFHCLYYILLLGLVTGWWLRVPAQRWRLAVATAMSLVLAGLCAREMQSTRLTILPANGGLLVHFKPAGLTGTMLVDTGNTNAVRFITRPFLQGQGANLLSALVLTHGDLQHVGGAETLPSLIPVTHVYASPLRFRSRVYRSTLAHYDEKGLLHYLHRGEHLETWLIVHPDLTDRFARADDAAMALLGTVGRAQILLLSDLGRAGQNALLSRQIDLHADVVVTGLPTTGEPLCDDLLNAIQPRLIVIADSALPAAARALPPLKNRLARSHIPVLYTRDCGATTLEWKYKCLEIRTMAGDRFSLPF